MAFDELLTQAARELREPAGPSPRFSSFAAIKENRRDFVIECHNTWKRWHTKAIEEILVFESFGREEKRRPIGQGAAQWAEYSQAVWRRVSDTIIWSLMGRQRHVVKRLCLYRSRTVLTESNAAAVMQTLAEMNSDPMSIAIWNDATSCVDIGDVTFVPDGMVPNPNFFELKQGSVNIAIAELLRAENADFDVKFSEFEKKYGKKGTAQFNRVKRQETVSDQALALLSDEKGVDPVTGRYIRVTEVTTPWDGYDEILNALLKATLDRRTAAIDVIDGCLWIYANADKAVPGYQVRHDFCSLLSDRLPAARHAAAGRPAWDRDRIVCLNDGFFSPLALPLFLRGLDPDVVAAVTYGDLMFRVYFYIDWDRFGAIVAEEGATFSWSSAKDARRALAMTPTARPALVKGLLPQISTEDARFQVTDPMIVQLLFDGLTPRAIVKQTLEVLAGYKKGG